MKRIYILTFIALIGISSLLADNPLITHMYTADPTARVMNGKLFVFPSTDIPPVEREDKTNNFFMPYYHVFSTENLMDYTDHGKQIDQTDVPWGEHKSYAMWAPDCVEYNGKFYHYFPARPKSEYGKNVHKIGVAIADNPEGPYVVEPNPVSDIMGIDPNVFIDDDGKAYIYWGSGEKIYAARLKKNMKELATEPTLIKGLPSQYKEAFFVFKRDGIYYFTFSHTTPPRSCCELSYCVAESPMGEAKYKGAFMKKWTNCWTNHHSFVNYKGDWILFYHYHDISNKQHQRSIRADYVTFDKNGGINMVSPTLRGIGVCDAGRKINIDRYSDIVPYGLKVNRIDNTLPAQWCVEVTDVKNTQEWVSYNTVDFSAKKYTKAKVRVSSKSDAKNMKIVIRENGFFGEVIATIPVAKSNEYTEVLVPLSYSPDGIVNLFCIFEGDQGYSMNVDWVQFL